MCWSALLRIPSPRIIALGPIRFTTATLSVREKRKCQKNPTIEGLDLTFHPANLVDGGRIFFRSNIGYRYMAHFDAV